MGRAGLALAALSAVAVLSVLLVGVDVRGNLGGSGWGSEGEIAGGVVGRGGAVELLDWWKPTIADTAALKEKSASPSGPSASKSSGSKKEGSRGRVAGTASSGSGAPATVPVMKKGGGNGATSGQVDKVTKYYDDMTARSIEPSEYDDDEDISEGELAGRLGRAIDAHEKCRRHWPHLEKLEAAQEIRVHDARNNLEVANRGVERARKELSDAENLVMAARSEHQTYEHQRVDFQRFKDAHDAQMSVYNRRERSVELYEQREEEGEAELKAHLAAEERLSAASVALENNKARLVELESRDRASLDEIGGSSTTTLSAKTASLSSSRDKKVGIVHGQELAEVGDGAAKSDGMWKESHGIVVPQDSAAAKQQGEAEGSGGSEEATRDRISALQAETEKLSSREVAAFARLPRDEARGRKLEEDAKRDGSKKDIAGSREAVLKSRLERDEKMGAPKKVQVLDGDKLSLSKLDRKIYAKRMAKAVKEEELVKADEEKGPELSRKLAADRGEAAALGARLERSESLRAAEGEGAAHVRLLGGGGSGKARLQQLSMEQEGGHARRVPRTRAQLKADLAEKSAELKKIRDRMVAVGSKLKPQEARVAVDRQRLKSRRHELARATRLAQASSAAAPHIGDREYNMKIRDLREERKRADGLLAKAERMLNVAREDTEHASRSKAAALEELKYATAKLRKYQHLRALSQECQMRAWNTIRRLTHRARERRMLGMKEEGGGGEALKGVLAEV